MADSSVAITAGSGTSIDTRTESNASDHRQVVVLGDPVDGNRVVGVNSEGGLVVDIDTSGQLDMILRELRRMNLYMALLTNTEITNDDLGELGQ